MDATRLTVLVTDGGGLLERRTAYVTAEDGVLYKLCECLDGDYRVDWSDPIRLVGETELIGWGELDGPAVELDNGWIMGRADAEVFGLYAAGRDVGSASYDGRRALADRD